MRCIGELAELRDGEYACIRADPHTGHLVERDGHALNRPHRGIPVFGSLDDAREFAYEEWTRTGGRFEYAVYGEQGERVWVLWAVVRRHAAPRTKRGFPWLLGFVRRK